MAIDDTRGYGLDYDEYPLCLDEIITICELPNNYQDSVVILKVGEAALDGKLKFNGIICSFPSKQWHDNMELFAKRMQKLFEF